MRCSRGSDRLTQLARRSHALTGLPPSALRASVALDCVVWPRLAGRCCPTQYGGPAAPRGRPSGASRGASASPPSSRPRTAVHHAQYPHSSRPNASRAPRIMIGLPHTSHARKPIMAHSSQSGSAIVITPSHGPAVACATNSRRSRTASPSHASAAGLAAEGAGTPSASRARTHSRRSRR